MCADRYRREVSDINNSMARKQATPYLQRIQVTQTCNGAHQHRHQHTLDCFDIRVVHDVVLLERLCNRQHKALVTEREAGDGLWLCELTSNVLANQFTHLIRCVVLQARIGSDRIACYSIAIGNSDEHADGIDGSDMQCVHYTLPSKYISLVTAASVVISAPATTPASFNALQVKLIGGQSGIANRCHYDVTSHWLIGQIITHQSSCIVCAHTTTSALCDVDNHDSTLTCFLESCQEILSIIGGITYSMTHTSDLSNNALCRQVTATQSIVHIEHACSKGLQHTATNRRLQEVADRSFSDTWEQAHRCNIGTQLRCNTEPVEWQP
jgi:hypothetical protein